MGSIHSQYISLIPALPAGAIIKRIGLASAGEYEFIGNHIIKATPRSATQVIVEPAPGYAFKFQIETNSFTPVISAARTMTVTFDVSKPEHANFVKGLEHHPAHVSTTESNVPSVGQALSGSQLEIVKEATPANIHGQNSPPSVG